MPDLLQKLIAQHQKKLPFAAYRKPGEKLVNVLLQNDDTIFHITDFSEKGFVFAPFDLKKNKYYIPCEKSDCFEIPFESGKPQENLQKGFPDDSAEKNKHIQLVQKGIDAIKTGQFEKVVISRKLEVNIGQENPIDIFSNLLQTYPQAFVYCWFHPKTGMWMGATPETLLKVESKHFQTMALAGTQKYVPGKEIFWGEKEKEEQGFVTDFLLSELQGKVDNIQFSETETIRAGNLLHLKTSISGQVQTSNLKQITEALHPTPAVCGLPKQAAKDFILRNENYDRGFYTGFLGELNVDNKTNLYVNLRCMKIEKEKAVLYVGGGITKDSDPESEWEETRNKAGTMLRVL